MATYKNVLLRHTGYLQTLATYKHITYIIGYLQTPNTYKKIVIYKHRLLRNVGYLPILVIGKNWLLTRTGYSLELITHKH